MFYFGGGGGRGEGCWQKPETLTETGVVVFHLKQADNEGGWERHRAATLTETGVVVKLTAEGRGNHRRMGSCVFLVGEVGGLALRSRH